MMAKKKGFEYKHYRSGDIIKIEIRDMTYRVVYRKKFNINDKNAILNLLVTLEKYSGFSILELIKERMNIGEWF